MVVCRSSANKHAEFINSIVESFQQQSLPWINDLIAPILFNSNRRAFEDPSLLPSPELLVEEDSNSNFITVYGVKMHYKEYRSTRPSSKRATLILLHGFNGSVFSWRASITPALLAHYRIIAFDRPPFGLSERPLSWSNKSNTTTKIEHQQQTLDFNPYELSGSLKLAEGLINALCHEHESLVLVGHSAGALTALELYQRLQHRVAGITLIAPAVPTTPEHSFQRRATFGQQLRLLVIRGILQSDELGLKYVERQIIKQKERVMRGELGFRVHPYASSRSVWSLSSLEQDDADIPDGNGSFKSDRNGTGIDYQSNSVDYQAVDIVDSEEEEDQAKHALQEAVEGYLKPLKAKDWNRAALLNLRAFSLPMSYDYNTVQVPVLVVQGTHDRSVPPENARALIDMLQKRSGDILTQYVELNCGHSPMDELPFEYTSAVESFLAHVFHQQH